MNYFEKVKRLRHILGPWMQFDYPHTWALCFDYAERMLLNKVAGRPFEYRNPFRADFQGTRRLSDPRFLIKTVIYYSLKSERISQRHSILLSYTLNQRFPNLDRRIALEYPTVMFVTKTSSLKARKSGRERFIKIDSIVYNKAIERPLAHVISVVRRSGVEERGVEKSHYGPDLDRLENALRVAVSELAELLKRYRVNQFVLPYSSRFEDILLCHACATLGIPSKEICHGVNSHKLELSDNVVPTNADILYVWNRQFYDGISSFENPARIAICGYPKYSLSDILEFKERFHAGKRITFFSQATYDIGSHTDETITPEFIESEREFREQLFEQLKRASDELGYGVRIRYHPGEKVPSAVCDRRSEMEKCALLGFEISANPFEQDIFESELCIGINTSALYEAFVMGRSVLQMRFAGAGPENFHKVIDRIDVKDLVARAEQISQIPESERKPREELLMNIEKFLEDRLSPNQR